MPIVSSESFLKRHAGFYADQHKRQFFFAKPGSKLSLWVGSCVSCGTAGSR
jgi:hypothetical protein